jgi:flavin-dependent dehydrogenase
MYQSDSQRISSNLTFSTIPAPLLAMPVGVAKQRPSKGRPGAPFLAMPRRRGLRPGPQNCIIFAGRAGLILGRVNVKILVHYDQTVDGFMAEFFDILIVGGGPAGSTAGTLLAKKGWNVAILEKEKFPRFKIGESLLPGSLCTFERMGVREKIEQADFVTKYGGRITSACGTRTNRFLFKDVFRCKYPTAYQVERAVFDKILLDHAGESGCRVFEGLQVTDINFDADGVTVRAGDDEYRARYLIDCSGRNCIVGSRYKLRRNYPGLRKFSLYAHFEDVDREPGIEGTLTRMIRCRDRWIWMIPITSKKTSVGIVMNADAFKRTKSTPQDAYMEILGENPQVMAQMSKARRVTQVYSVGDFSYRNKRLTGDRWVLAGDAAGFIDPVWSTGVFIAVLSGEKAADMLDRTLRLPQRRAAEFARYERHVGRVLDLYLKFVKAWYTQEFAEVFFNPSEFFQLVPAVNSVLAGSERRLPEVRWRLWIFDFLVFLQKRFAMIAPRMSFQPK